MSPSTRRSTSWPGGRAIFEDVVCLLQSIYNALTKFPYSSMYNVVTSRDHTIRKQPMTRSLVLVVSTLLACSGGADPIVVPPPPPPPPPSGAVSILMIGNSLTSTWDIPGMVADYAVEGGSVRPTVTSSTQGNYSIEDHWGYQPSRTLAGSGDYDYIILQQGPSTLDTSRENLIVWSAMFRDLVSKDPVRLGLYGVWPPAFQNLNSSIANYTTAAVTNNLALYPVGHAFREAIRLDPEVPLLMLDNFHASPTGAMLAAMVIAGTIFEDNVLTYPNLMLNLVDQADLQTLRLAADFAITNYALK